MNVVYTNSPTAVEAFFRFLAGFKADSVSKISVWSSIAGRFDEEAASASLISETFNKQIHVDNKHFCVKSIIDEVI